MDFMKKTAGRRSGNFSNSNSPCLKKLCSVKFPQFHDMLNESERYRVTANGLVVNVELKCKALLIGRLFRLLDSDHPGCAWKEMYNIMSINRWVSTIKSSQL